MRWWSGRTTRCYARNVTTGESYGNDWIVTGGLESGDQVIVAGLQGAREGGQAKAVPWQPPPLTASPTTELGGATRKP